MNHEPALQELYERRPRLLRVEVLRPRGPRSNESVLEIALSFDVSGLRVRAPAQQTELLCTIGVEAAQLEQGENAAEDEPWWRLLGSPLVAAWAIRKTEGVPELALQFRDDASNPRIVSLSRYRNEIRVRCEPKPQWLARTTGES